MDSNMQIVECEFRGCLGWFCSHLSSDSEKRDAPSALRPSRVTVGEAESAAAAALQLPGEAPKRRRRKSSSSRKLEYGYRVPSR